jgi:hypothetical protein
MGYGPCGGDSQIHLILSAAKDLARVSGKA